MKGKLALFAIMILVCSVYVSAFDEEVYGEFLEGSKSTIKVSMEPGDLYKFSHNGKMYNLIDWLTTSEQAGLQITPSALKFSILNGNSKKVDVEKDGIEDFEIKVISIDESKAELNIVDIDLLPLDTIVLNEAVENVTTNESVMVIENDSNLVVVEDTKEDGMSYWTISFIVLGIILILAMFAYFFLKGGKKSSGINVKDSDDNE